MEGIQQHWTGSAIDCVEERGVDDLNAAVTDDTPKTTGKTIIPDQGGAKSGALCAPADLQEVIDAWPDLPATVKAEVLAMVRATT